MANAIERTMAQCSERIEELSEKLSLLHDLNEALNDCPELADVESVWAVWTNPGITFYLEQAHRDSLLPAVIAERLGIQLQREVKFDGLNIVGTWRGTRLTVTNYLPTNCRVEVTTVELPEAEWTKTRMTLKVVCAELDEAL